MLYLCGGNSLNNKGKKSQRNYKEFVRDTFECVTCLLYVLWRALKKARKPPCFVVVILEGHGHCCTKVRLEKYRPIQVNIYKIAISFFHKSHELTCYCSAIVHKFTRIYPVWSTYELTKQFMQICVKRCKIGLTISCHTLA